MKQRGYKGSHLQRVHGCLNDTRKAVCAPNDVVPDDVP